LAADEFIRLRQQLIRFFLSRGISAAEDLADNTLERVANRLDKGEVVSDLQQYSFGVARRVFTETLRQRRREFDVEELLSKPVLKERSELEPYLECLESCLELLSKADRRLVLAYYQDQKQ